METLDSLKGIADLFLTIYPRFKHLLVTQPRPLSDEITIGQTVTLGKLLDQPLTVGALAEQLNVTRQGASLQAQYLVEQGWVRRIPDPADRRSALLELSDEGRAQLLLARHELIDYLAVAFGQLTPEEIAACRTAFLALERVLDQSDSSKEA